MAELFIKRQVRLVMKADHTKWKAETTDDTFTWTVVMNGPPNSPYAGGVFRFKIHFGPDYPLKPPQVALVTPIYHPNFGIRNGLELKLVSCNYWSPATTMSQVFDAIYHLLEKPDTKNPHPDSTSIAELIENNEEAFKIIATKYTAQHAQA